MAWQYIAYARLKRLIERSRLKLPKGDSDDELTKPPKESTPLINKAKKPDSFYDKTGGAKIEDAYVDEFFPMLEEELARINKFYVGKLAEIRLSNDLIQVKRDNWYQSHHTGNKPSDLYVIRDMYIECKALLSYQKLNRTGAISTHISC